MFIKRRLTDSLVPLLLGAALSTACGDDDGGELAETDATDMEPTDETDEPTDAEPTDTDEPTDVEPTDETDVESTDATDADAGPIDGTDVEPTDAVSGCYFMDDHSCDCDLAEEECAEAEGTWTTECDASCGEGTDAEPDPEYAPLTQGSAEVHPAVNDIKGLSFAADGKIYASGFVGMDTTDPELAVMRFNADGAPDDTFGTDGLITHNLVEQVLDGETVVNDGVEEGYAIAELAGGELIVLANVTDDAGLGTDVVLVKLDAAGDFVTSFGTDGVLRLDLGWTAENDADWPVEGEAASDQGWDVIVDDSSGTEKLVVFAHGPAPVGGLVDAEDPLSQRTDNDRFVFRLLASDGSPDPDFNGGVAFTMNTGGVFSDNARRGYVAEDGSILSAGYTNFGDGLDNHVVIIALTSEGTLDSDFGFGIGVPGVVRTNPFIDDGGMAECYALGVQSTGHVVTTGYGRATGTGLSSGLGYVTTDEVDIVSFRLSDSGLDTTYGTQGTVALQSEEFALATTEDRGRDMVVLPDDRVVHAGRFGGAPALLVTLPDGNMDLASGTDGRFLYEQDVEQFFKVALSPDGSTVVAATRAHANGVLLSVLEVASE